MAIIPAAIALIPAIPGLIRDVIKISEAIRELVKGGPPTAEAKEKLDAELARIASDWDALLERVKDAPLPAPPER